MKSLSRIKMPSNILFVKEVKKNRIPKTIRPVEIRNGTVRLLQHPIEYDIYRLRDSLEKVWNEETRYPGTNFQSSDYPSKGQCGVSSMHLARYLQSRGYEVKFCEGNVYFPEGKTSIMNHCWIKLVNYYQNGKNAIIDITADQNGHRQGVIFKSEGDLTLEGIRYETSSEGSVNEVGVEHLIERLKYLEQSIRNK